MRSVPTWGYRGVRVGEASNPGPAVTHQGSRLLRSTQIDVSSDEEPLVRPNFGRHVVARRIIEEDVPSTVPATPVSLAQRERPLFLSSDAIDVEEHAPAPAELARTTLRDDSDADEEVVERCHTLPTQPASAAALRGLGRGLESNRFFSLATDSEDEEGERRTTFDEDSCSDTVSLVGRRNPRRLRLRWSEGSPCREQETRVDTPDSHDERSRRAREALQRDSSRPIMGVSGSNIESDVPNRRRQFRAVRNDDPDSEAQTALTLLNVLARRVGAVPVEAPVPVAIRQHRWSPLFVPLLWSAAGVEATTPVLEMLVRTASSVSEPIQFHGSNTAAAEAVRVGWTALRGVLRMWGVDAQLQLSNWLRNQGFAATRPGHHIPARAQERILSQACEVDARVALLEAVFVTIVLHLGRESGIPAVTRDRAPEVRRIRQSVPATVPSESWAQLDQVNLQDWFARRCPMLKTCPYFMRGRLRQSLAVALRERSRAKDVGDVVGEERAWKVFGLIHDAVAP